jgi:hypothetical protein
MNGLTSHAWRVLSFNCPLLSVVMFVCFALMNQFARNAAQIREVKIPAFHGLSVRGKNSASIDNIARIASGLQVEPWKLLKGD